MLSFGEFIFEKYNRQLEYYYKSIPKLKAKLANEDEIKEIKKRIEKIEAKINILINK